MPCYKIYGKRYKMAANQKFIRYEEDIRLEIYGTNCIKAENLFDDIRKEIKSESQMMAGFITVKEYSKDLRNKQKKYRA